LYQETAKTGILGNGPLQTSTLIVRNLCERQLTLVTKELERARDTHMFSWQWWNDRSYCFL